MSTLADLSTSQFSVSADSSQQSSSSVISKYIKRFRYAAPSAPDERDAVSDLEAFWWISPARHSLEEEVSPISRHQAPKPREASIQDIASPSKLSDESRSPPRASTNTIAPRYTASKKCQQRHRAHLNRLDRSEQSINKKCTMTTEIAAQTDLDSLPRLQTVDAQVDRNDVDDLNAYADRLLEQCNVVLLSYRQKSLSPSTSPPRPLQPQQVGTALSTSTDTLSTLGEDARTSFGSDSSSELLAKYHSAALQVMPDQAQEGTGEARRAGKGLKGAPPLSPPCTARSVQHEQEENESLFLSATSSDEESGALGLALALTPLSARTAASLVDSMDGSTASSLSPLPSQTQISRNPDLAPAAGATTVAPTVLSTALSTELLPPSRAAAMEGVDWAMVGRYVASDAMLQQLVQRLQVVDAQIAAAGGGR
jgi:hypothetical protein